MANLASLTQHKNDTQTTQCPSDRATWNKFFYSLVVILAAFAIEYMANYTPKSEPKPKLEPTDNNPNRSTSPAPTPAPASADSPPPPPALRTYRFGVVTVLLLPLCLAFGYRLSWEFGCESATTNWWLVIAFAILPFTSAVCAWARTAVDCVLVRYGKHLNNMTWPPCVIWIALFMLCVLPFFLLYGAASAAALGLTGGQGAEGVGVENVATKLEEEVELMGGVDGEVEGGDIDEGLPPYEV